MTEVSRECWDEIMHELEHGTPNTPERIELMKRADEIYRRMGVAHPDGGAPPERRTCPECNVTTVAASKFNAGWRWHGEGCSRQVGGAPPEPTRDIATHCYCCGAGLDAGPSWEPSSDALQAAVDADERRTGTARVRKILQAGYAVDFGRAASRPGDQ